MAEQVSNGVAVEDGKATETPPHGGAPHPPSLPPPRRPAVSSWLRPDACLWPETSPEEQCVGDKH